MGNLRPISLICLALGALACATPAMRVPARVDSGFDPARDTFAYANELIWEYRDGVPVDPRRARSGATGGEAPAFGQRCPAMVRMARQFHYGARFEPSLPRASMAEVEALVGRVLATDPRRDSPVDAPVVIPGFTDLREFSAAHEDLLKSRTGGRWRSYLQRGNWRMIFPFGSAHQHRTAESLLGSLERGHPPIVHVLNFPDIDVNHTTLLYRAEATALEIRFSGYDPNTPDRPIALRYDREAAAFFLGPTPYFAGGPVKAYEVYDGWLY